MGTWWHGLLQLFLFWGALSNLILVAFCATWLRGDEWVSECKHRPLKCFKWNNYWLAMLWCNKIRRQVAWIIWRGTRNKALSDTWCNVKFSFCFTSKYKAIWKENLVVNQMSRRAFFHASCAAYHLKRRTLRALSSVFFHFLPGLHFNNDIMFPYSGSWIQTCIMSELCQGSASESKRINWF